MKIINKPWGIARLIHKGPHTEVWHCSIRAGGVSTDGKYHKHELKTNDFYILDGTLKLCVAENSYLLASGDCHQVRPGFRHRFEAVTDVELIETYHLPLIDEEDIVRDECREAVQC